MCKRITVSKRRQGDYCNTSAGMLVAYMVEGSGQCWDLSGLADGLDVESIGRERNQG